MFGERLVASIRSVCLSRVDSILFFYIYFPFIRPLITSTTKARTKDTNTQVFDVVQSTKLHCEVCESSPAHTIHTAKQKKTLLKLFPLN